MVEKIRNELTELSLRKYRVHNFLGSFCILCNILYLDHPLCNFLSYCIIVHKKKEGVVSHRVTIAVPDQLFERLRTVKHNFNISSICQEALEMSIKYEELKLTQTETQSDLIERLRVEKTVLLHKVHQEGFELGIRSSSKLSYQDFCHFERVSSLATSLDEEVLDYLWSFLDFKEYPEQARLHDPDFAHLLEVDAQSRITFAQGWMEGVLSVWQTLKPQVDTAHN